jgi:transcription-repair coupling factor (superfamily II helicase)
MSRPADRLPPALDGCSPLHPPLPARGAPPLYWVRPAGSGLGLALAVAAARAGRPILVVVADTPAAQRLEAELRFFSAAGDLPVLTFPDWETLPYDAFSPHQDIVSQRLATLYRLPELTGGVLIVPAPTLMQRLPPRGFLDARCLLLRTGERFDPESMRRRLTRSGYRCVAQVMEHGEYALRGSVMDLYPMGGALPYRVDLFDNEIESLRTFDPETQRTLERVDSVRLLPGREFPQDEDAVRRFRGAFRAHFEGDPQASPIYRDVSQGLAPGGIEYYLPLFLETTQTLFDHLPEDVLLLRAPGVGRSALHFWEEITDRYEQGRHDRERPLLPPAQLYLPPPALEETLGALTSITVCDSETDDAGPGTAVALAVREPPRFARDARGPFPAAAVQRFVAEFPGRVLFLAETAGRREALREQLTGCGIAPADVHDWTAFLAGTKRCAITVAPLEDGLILGDPPVAVIPEARLLGERARRRRRRETSARDGAQRLRDLSDLHIGAPVVHEDHGVGRYLGLRRLTVGGADTEFLTLEYAGGDKLYVPVSSLHLVGRYSGAATESAPLHKLGGDQWRRARRRAAERVHDAAAELLEIHARRAARDGHAFRIQEEDYAAFVAAFPFEETPDQEEAIERVREDMAATHPMDRVVCGDVGFGKTEVALRAAFIAVQDGRQTAVLVPTTLLAQQHLQTFQDRFADWPVHVESLSRFSSRKQQDAVLAEMATGRMDIVIGTHRLLQGNVRFKDLGLVIVDEEHRFGVRHKERLKALRAEVDLLTLTATPIPRTLNMALSGLRDLSIIATPPEKRLSIKTFLCQWDKRLLREACLREVARGGQVYFVHNEVQSIERIAREVAALVPEATVRIAHGQMHERELEQVMLDFYHQRFNVLVCTTIIESGIDVPSANTMIVHRADRFGLAQLHQLRGRVGRSHHRAYAYLVTPPEALMSADALKRLEAITAMEDLGAGFTLATQDLEIRGAGELLGDEQSGQIREIGFDLYTELLERAVADLKDGRQPELERPLDHGPEMDLHLPALLPEDYLPDVHLRLIHYKRIAGARCAAELRELQVEMIDRFGLLPPATKNLFRLAELKLKAAPLGVTRIEAGEAGARIVFGPQPALDPARIIRLVQEDPGSYRLHGADTLRVSAPFPDPERRVTAMERLLDYLSGGETP